MTQPLKQIESLSNEEIDLQVALLEGWQIDNLSPMGYIQISRIPNSLTNYPIIGGREVTTVGKGYSPTTNWEAGGAIIDREKIKIKHYGQGLFCIPVFEYQGKIDGIFISPSHLRTGMLYYLAKKTGLVRESN